MDLNYSLEAAKASGIALNQSKLRSLSERFKNHENREDLKKTAKEFEGIFVQQLLNEMDKTVNRENSLLGGGSAEETFRGMMNERVAQMIANRPGGSGLGLAQAVYRQLEKRLPKEAAEATTETGGIDSK